MKLPGFTADASLHNYADVQTILAPAGRGYRRKFPSRIGAGVVPQLGIGSDPDLGAYWRCRLNGGSELICRFFGGLPPFTIGRLLIGR